MNERRHSVFDAAELSGASEPDMLGRLSMAAPHTQAARIRGALGVRTLAALQPISPVAMIDEARSETLVQDIELMSSLRLPGNVHVLGATSVDGRPYLARELIAGADVGTLLQRTHFAPTLASYVMSRVAAALVRLHGARDLLGAPLGLRHGSITPDKIIASFTGEVSLLPFARPATTARAHGSIRAWPEHLHPWLPPERLDGGPASVASDLFMLGVSLYTLVTGAPPVPAGLSLGKANRDLVVPPSKVVADIRPSFEDLVMALLDPEPARRPQSAMEVHEALDSERGRGRLVAFLRDELADERAWWERLVGSEPEDVPSADPLHEQALPEEAQSKLRKAQAEGKPDPTVAAERTILDLDYQPPISSDALAPVAPPTPLESPAVELRPEAIASLTSDDEARPTDASPRPRLSSSMEWAPGPITLDDLAAVGGGPTEDLPDKAYMSSIDIVPPAPEVIDAPAVLVPAVPAPASKALETVEPTDRASAFDYDEAEDETQLGDEEDHGDGPVPAAPPLDSELALELQRSIQPRPVTTPAEGAASPLLPPPELPPHVLPGRPVSPPPPVGEPSGPAGLFGPPPMAPVEDPAPRVPMSALESAPTPLEAPLETALPAPAARRQLDLRVAVLVSLVLIALSGLIWVLPLESREAHVELHVTPDLAQATWDGAPVRGPHETRSGDHHLEVVAQGHVPYRSVESLAPGERRVVVVSLAPAEMP